MSKLQNRWRGREGRASCLLLSASVQTVNLVLVGKVSAESSVSLPLGIPGSVLTPYSCISGSRALPRTQHITGHFWIRLLYYKVYGTSTLNDTSLSLKRTNPPHQSVSNEKVQTTYVHSGYCHQASERGRHIPVPGRQVSSVYSCHEMPPTATGNMLLLTTATRSQLRFHAKYTATWQTTHMIT